MKHLLLAALSLSLISSITLAQAPAKEAPKDAAKPAAEPVKPAAKPTARVLQEPKVKPTFANVPYGDDPVQVIDFYQAESKEPTPLLVNIHGGGWMGGDKSGVGGLAALHAAGISVASVEYRFVSQAAAAGIKPPVQWPLHDAARALQFIRSKAKEWNIDKSRVACTGGSAGACTSLWLAFHDDLADPKSSDPVARESTRITCAAVIGAQTSLDPKQMKEWMPNSSYGGHAFGQPGFVSFLANREQIMPWIKEYSPYELVTSDDPPIYLQYGPAPEMGKETKDPTHSANFGLGLQEKLKSVGVECELNYNGATDIKHKNTVEFIIDKLKAKKS